MRAGQQSVSGVLDRGCDRPVYKQLADILRELIVSGTLPPGASLPSETGLAQEFRIGRERVRQAVGVLRAEGLVDTSRGRGIRVRARVDLVPVGLGRGDRAAIRMPSEPERCRHDIAEGVAVVAIHRSGGTVEVHPADRIELVGWAGANRTSPAVDGSGRWSRAVRAVHPPTLDSLGSGGRRADDGA